MLAARLFIIGEDEIAQNTVVVKAMRADRVDDNQNNQTSVPFDSLVDYVVDQIVGADEHDHSHNHNHTHH